MTPGEIREVLRLAYVNHAKALGLSVDELKVWAERPNPFAGLSRAEAILRSFIPEKWSIEDGVAQGLEDKDILFRSRYEDLVEAMTAAAVGVPTLARWNVSLDLLEDFGPYSPEYLAGLTMIYFEVKPE